MKATDELEKLDRAERELLSRREKLTAALLEATEARGARILDSIIAGAEPSVPDTTVAELQAELSGIAQALSLLTRQRPAVATLAKQEEAAGLRKRAEELSREADVHEAKTKELLAQLFEHEHAHYEVTTSGPMNQRIPRSTELHMEAKAKIAAAKRLEREVGIEDPETAGVQAPDLGSPYR